MRDDDFKTELAALRKRLRRIENEMACIRNESQRFRRMGFGRDIKDIQLMALEEERDSCLKRLAVIQRETARRRPSHFKVADLILIPIALVILGFQALGLKREKQTAQEAYPRCTKVGMRPIPAVDAPIRD